MKKSISFILFLIISFIFAQEKEINNKKEESTIFCKTKSTDKLPLYAVVYKGQKIILNAKHIDSVKGSDIISVKVLKGTDATNNYFEKGINGVIEIYLKESTNSDKIFNDLQKEAAKEPS